MNDKTYCLQIKFVASQSLITKQPKNSAASSSGKAPTRFTPQTSAEFIPSSHQSSRSHREEVSAAARWWTMCLRQHDLSQQEVAAFELALRNGMESRCEGHWYPSEPRRGSGHRSVVNDLTTDPLLVSSAMTARIRDVSTRLPRAVLWINPGNVRVQVEGERTPQDIFPVPGFLAGKIETVGEHAGSDEDQV
jgi:hypothetical protein